MFNKQLFASRLLWKMEVNELTVRSAAKEIGISAATLNRLTNEILLPSIDSYYLCCKWLGLKMEFFFTN